MVIRKRVNRDLNHTEIVTGLIKAGYTVVDLAEVGKGCPDILVGVRGASGTRYNLLLEIKQTVKSVEQPTQINFRKHWQGQQTVVYNLNDAIFICESYKRK
jgi:hypothetical protein